MARANAAELAVRPVVLSDWATLWPLLEAMGKTDGAETVRTRFSRLAGDNDHLLLVAVLNDAVVGYAWAQDRGAHLRSGSRSARIHDLFVAETQRRRGVGRALFTGVKDWANEHGIRWLEWQASAEALDFYQRLGLQGDPCPDPGHPFFEIDFAAAAEKVQST